MDDWSMTGRMAFWFGGKETDPPRAREHLYSFDFGTSSVSRVLDDAEENRLLQSASHLDASLDGRMVALTGWVKELRAGSNRILLLDAASRQVRVLVSNERNNIFPRFSPDGREVAFYSSDPDMQRNNWDLFHTKGFALSVVDVATSAIRQLAHEDWRLMRDGPPSWSPDGKYVAYSAMYDQKETWQIYIVPSSGGESRRVSPPGAKACSRPVWLNGDTMLYYANTGVHGPGLYVVRRDGTGDRLLFRGAVSTTPDASADGQKICFMGVSLDSRDLTRDGLVVLDLSGRTLPGPRPDIMLHKWRR
jgi:Tol biopolymer transport system component